MVIDVEKMDMETLANRVGALAKLGVETAVNTLDEEMSSHAAAMIYGLQHLLAEIAEIADAAYNTAVDGKTAA